MDKMDKYDFQEISADNLIVKGRLDITIKFNVVPSRVRTTSDNRKEFIVDADGLRFIVNVKNKSFNKFVKTAKEYKSWTASISGKMGKKKKEGFELLQAGIQVFEKKSESE